MRSFKVIYPILATMVTLTMMEVDCAYEIDKFMVENFKLVKEKDT